MGDGLCMNILDFSFHTKNLCYERHFVKLNFPSQIVMVPTKFVVLLITDVSLIYLIPSDKVANGVSTSNQWVSDDTHNHV
jgi:hypothetical protein